MTRFTCDIWHSVFPRKLDEGARDPSKTWQIRVAILAFSSVAIACQQKEALERTQDDTSREDSGGAPVVSPSLPTTLGGNGGSAGAANELEPEPATVSQLPCEVEAIFEDYCFKCHADRIEPRLDLYESAVLAAPLIRGALVGTGPREMPPRESLPDDLRQQIVDWIKAGTPPAPSNALCP